MNRKKEIFFAVREFIIFSLLVAFVVTCNMVLFLKRATISDADIRHAAPITFVNVFIIAGIFTIIDQVRRYYQITRPVRKIQEGLNRVMSGDFTTQLQKFSDSSYAYDTIISSINVMIKELGSVETLGNDFISNVSHEIKTPLAVMQNYATLLEAYDLSDEKRLEYAAKIMEQTRRLSFLITNILKLNKLENQQIFPQMEELDLGECVCESVLNFEQAWEDKNIEIETDIMDNVMVRGDKEMLSLVWNNLMSNALKFTPDGGKIQIKVCREKGRGIVSISDNGCGMDAQTGKNIFKKFYQGDTSHAAQGNGLGLALVKRVVDIHKGDIAVESRLGEGSTFVVSLQTDKQ